MRIMITTPSGLGHVLPMVPLARSLQARGHDVRWATSEDTRDWVEEAGLPTISAGLGAGERFAEFWRRHPEARQLPPDQVPDLMFPGMFGGIAAPAMLAALLPVVEEWRPTLMVHDAAELAAPIVAAGLGIPHVTKGFGALVPAHRVAAAGEATAGLWQSVGLEPKAYAGLYEWLYLDVYPPILRPWDAPHVSRREALRPIAYDVAGPEIEAVEPPTEHDARPLVYVTLGTIFSDPGVLARIVGAIAGIDAGLRVLVTVGPRGDPAALGTLPDHVRVERYVPQTAVLGRSAVVVSHGGSGTVLGALAVGVPQLCLPQGADQFLNASAVAASGAGLALNPDEATPAAIAAAVTRLLSDDSFRIAASEVAVDIASMPGPDDVAELVEGLA